MSDTPFVPREFTGFRSLDDLREHLEQGAEDFYRKAETELLTMPPPAGMALDPDLLADRMAACRADAVRQIESALERVQAAIGGSSEPRN